MTGARPVVAVLPFAAARADAAAGRIARQLARRIVDRFDGHGEVEVRPLVLVALPREDPGSGYLVAGSAPDPARAAGYGRDAGAAWVLTGEWRDEGGERTLALALVESASGAVRTALALPAPADRLPLLDGAAAADLAAALAVAAPDVEPVTLDEAAYVAFLEALDDELTAAILEDGDPRAARAARDAALAGHAAALRRDPGLRAAEDRLLVLATASLEDGTPEAARRALEAHVETSPRAWRAQYLLGELRRRSGDASGAILAWRQADAIHPLGDADLLRLAELERSVGATASANAHLRRVGDTPAQRLARAQQHAAAGAVADALAELDALGPDARGAEAAQARRLRLRLRHPDLERDLERAGELALGGADRSLDEAVRLLAAVSAAEPDLWEAQFGVGLVARRRGDHAAAAAAFRRALALWPAQPDATHELGVSLLLDDHPTEALEHLEAAARARADDPAYLADAGYAQLRAGHLGAARERLVRARALDAADPVTAAYLAELERVEALVRGGR